MGAKTGNHSRRTLVWLLLIMVMTLAACGSDSGSDPATSESEAARESSPNSGSSEDESAPTSPNSVSMKLIAFKPGNLEVASGAEVTWTQEDAGFHTVSSGTVVQGGAGVTQEPDGKFKSGRLATDDKFSFTFDQPGTYPYFCEIHPATMSGEVTVKG